MSDELTQRKAAVKDRVRKVLELCDPDKADKVQMLLNKFDGRERELFQKLEDTYSAHENYPKSNPRLDPQLEELLRGLEAARAAAQTPVPVIHTASTAASAESSSQADTAGSAKTAVAATKPAVEAEKRHSEDTNTTKTAENPLMVISQTHETKERAQETKPEASATGELIIRTCIFTGCRRARIDQYLCGKHAQCKPRPDGLLALVTSWSMERLTTMTVMWEVQMMVLPSSTKYGQKVSEPLVTVTKLRFSDLQALYKKIKSIHKAKPGYHDDLKELPKFAKKHELSTAGKFFGSNEVFNDDFLAQRQTELQVWLDKILDAPKIKFIAEFWSALGLRCVDGEYLEKDK